MSTCVELVWWSRFDCLNLFSECLYSIDCIYCFLDLFELFALFVFFDGLDWLCDAKLPYLFILFIGFVWTVCIVSMGTLILGFFVGCLNGLYRFDSLHCFLEDLGQS